MNIRPEPNGHYGKAASLEGPWTPEDADYIRKNGVVELRIGSQSNYALHDVDFLAEVPDLKVVRLATQGSLDIDGLYEVPGLLCLTLVAWPRIAIDFTRLKHLEELSYYEWTRGSSSLFEVKTLRRLMLVGYDQESSEAFAMLPNLEKLRIQESKLSEVVSLAKLKKVKELFLATLPRLTSLNGIQGMDSLEELTLGSVGRIGTIAPLAALNNLKGLTLWSAGKIDSVKYLESVPSLESVGIYGTTDVLDGDMSVFTRLPKLTVLALQGRRHYSHKPKDLIPLLSDGGARMAEIDRVTKEASGGA